MLYAFLKRSKITPTCLVNRHLRWITLIVAPLSYIVIFMECVIEITGKRTCKDDKDGWDMDTVHLRKYF